MLADDEVTGQGVQTRSDPVEVVEEGKVSVLKL